MRRSVRPARRDRARRRSRHHHVARVDLTDRHRDPIFSSRPRSSPCADPQYRRAGIASADRERESTGSVVVPATSWTSERSSPSKRSSAMTCRRSDGDERDAHRLGRLDRLCFSPPRRRGRRRFVESLSSSVVLAWRPDRSPRLGTVASTIASSSASMRGRARRHREGWPRPSAEVVHEVLADHVIDLVTAGTPACRWSGAAARARDRPRTDRAGHRRQQQRIRLADRTHRLAMDPGTDHSRRHRDRDACRSA